MKKSVTGSRPLIYSLLISAVITGVLSCSKNPPVIQPTQLTTTFKFSVNGTLYQWNGNSAADPTYGSRINKYSLNGATWYTLSAAPLNGGIYTLIGLKMQTSSLLAATYTLTTTTTTAWTIADHYCGVNNESYASSEIGDFASVTISSIHDGYADGSFTAKFTNANGSLTKINITDGEFHNVKIVE